MSSLLLKMLGLMGYLKIRMPCYLWALCPHRSLLTHAHHDALEPKDYPIMDRNMARRGGASSPAKPALHIYQSHQQ